MTPLLPYAFLLLAVMFMFSTATPAFAQIAPPNESDSVRVNVTINPDGSRTTYNFDPPNHKANAVTIAPDGKVLGKTNYRLDDANRFGTSVSFDAKGKFRLKSIYKYDAAGRLEQETQLGQDDAIRNRIVYSYDSAGHQTGYAIYDAAGKLLGQTAAPPLPAPPAATAKPGRKK